MSLTEQFLQVRGIARAWLLVEPNGNARPAPAVVFLHGLDDPSISEQTRRQYQFIAERARSLGFIAAFPRGLLGALPAQSASLGWVPVAEDENEDFICKLADVLVCDHNADATRLVLAGFSNGALLVAKVLLKATPFTSFFLSAGGELELAACPKTHRRPPVYVQIGLEDPYHLTPVRRMLDRLRSFGWFDGQTLLTVEHPGGHAFYEGDFDKAWKFLTS